MFLILQNQLYAQTVLGVDDTGETYVVFIYEDPGTGQDVLDNLEHLTVSLYCMRTLARYLILVKLHVHIHYNSVLFLTIFNEGAYLTFKSIFHKALNLC